MLHTLMKTKITELEVTENDFYTLTSYASDLQWPVNPELWPDTIQTDIGNKLPFIKQSVEIADDNFVIVKYHQALGVLTLRILND